MCPPVNVRHGSKGMSCLYAAWLYQLVHGDQMKICFACFKAAFLVVKNVLEMGDWEEEEWDAESMELSEAGFQLDASPGSEPSLLQNQGDLPQSVSEHGGPGALSPGHVGLQRIWPVPQPVPTELGPQEAVPLDLGPEDAEWTQTLPWRFDGLSPCSHWLIPPLSWSDIFNVSPSPGQPILLELSPIWPMDALEAETWLMNLKFVVLLGGFDVTCFLKLMTPCWAVRIQVQRWQLLLHPGDMKLAQLQKPPDQQYRSLRLSVLERSELGVELVPAACCLRSKGFRVHSYLPWQDDIPGACSREPRERVIILEDVSLGESTLLPSHLHNPSSLDTLPPQPPSPDAHP